MFIKFILYIYIYIHVTNNLGIKFIAYEFSHKVLKTHVLELYNN
jgi:hypothetical protein